jgi:hypothetical protein
MKKLLATLALISSNALAGTVFQYDYTINCADTDQIIETLTNAKYAEKLSWSGKDIEDGSMYSLWVNDEKGIWTLLKMSVQKVSCILGVGTHSDIKVGTEV